MTENITLPQVRWRAVMKEFINIKKVSFEFSNVMLIILTTTFQTFGLTKKGKEKF